MTDPLAQDRLLELIRDEHAHLLALLAQFDEPTICKVQVDGSWTIKDIVSHLSFWEGLIAAELADVRAGRVPKTIPAEAIASLNEQTYLRHRDQPLAVVRAELQRSMDSLLRQVELMEEELLQQTCGWTDEGSIAQHVANEMGHWQDHMRSIESRRGR